MKHQTFEDAAQIDLSKPSLEALSFLLRHRELWPKEFTWNYARCAQCAAGLAFKLWKQMRSFPDSSLSLEMAINFDMTQDSAYFIFCGATSKRHEDADDITPEMVADDIDAYLARSATFGQV